MEDSTVLEQFRQQWREEVNARTQRERKQTNTTQPAGGRHSDRPRAPYVHPPVHHPAADVKDEDFDFEERVEENDVAQSLQNLKIRAADDNDDDDEFKPKPSHEPQSALEHYERAVENEIDGKLGDSLSHYRQAFRLDSKVEQAYKKKHFPAQPKPSQPASSNDVTPAAATASSTEKAQIVLPPFPELINSYAGLPIEGADPVIKGDTPPPCPISNMPSEILHEIYLQLAISDPAAFAGLALVCKKFAFDVFKNKPVWRRLVLGPEFGIASQKYDFACEINGREIIHETLNAQEKQPIDDVLKLGEAHDHDWREVFHTIPRIRFNGVYISTVNYTRAGQGSATATTWSNAPIHIVTYYRYLRFFRDGTVISLLSIHEPSEVVHHLTKANLELIRLHPKEHHTSRMISTQQPMAPSTGAVPPLTHSVNSLMKHALRGRWRLCHPSVDRENPEIAIKSSAEEGDLHIETEGVGPRYMYTLHLSMKSNSRTRTTVKNNKLQWKGFWSFNLLANDWAEFQLKNDRAFIFSRVRSYGMGY